MASFSSTEGSGQQNRMPIDVLDPLFLHPSDHPGMLLVTKQMDGSNFGSWKKSFSIALSAKNKLTFVQGLVHKPATGEIAISNWQRCNDMVTSWILNTLTPDIAESVLFSKSASQIWKELEDRYGQVNGAKLYQLHKELVLMEQGSADIAAYYSKFKKIHDEFMSLRSYPPCTCGYAQALAKFEEDQRLIQFLISLNYIYGSIRGNILMMEPLPTLNQAYAILVQEEKQREMHTGGRIELETAAFVAEQNRRSSGGQYHGIQYSANSFVQGLGRARTDFRRNTLICNYCKRPGHISSRCYKLQGYPRENKPGRGRRFGATAQVTQSSYEEEATEDEKLNPYNLSSQEYNHLVKLMTKMKTSEAENAAGQPLLYAHFAGKTHTSPMPNSSCDGFDNEISTWIVDSGASDHMCFEEHMFEYMKQLVNPFNITMPNGENLVVRKVGKIKLNEDLSLNNVFYVPQFRYNLLSIGKLCKDLQCKVTFTEDSCYIQGLSKRSQAVLGDFHKGLYLLKVDIKGWRQKHQEKDEKFTKMSSCNKQTFCSKAMSNKSLDESIIL